MLNQLYLCLMSNHLHIKMIFLWPAPILNEVCEFLMETKTKAEFKRSYQEVITSCTATEIAMQF